MNLPVFEKLTFDKVDINSLENACRESSIGIKPLFIDPGDHNVQDLLDLLQEVVLNIGAHPLFPYPIYIVTQEIDRHSFFPIVATIDDLPSFWPREMTSRGKSRFDGKNRTLADKLKTTDLFSRHQTLKIFAIKHKMIFNNSKELDFYRSILESHNEE